MSNNMTISPTPANEPKPCAVREYTIGNTTYRVIAYVNDGATETADAKIRRLIRNEIAREIAKEKGEME